MNACGITFLIVAIIILVLVVFKLYLKLSTGWDRSPTCLVGKTAIVTGANTGIGFYIAQDFAKRGARVILACRDPKRGEEARNKIIDATGNENVTVKIVDLSSSASVRRFVVEVRATEERLDILVNNAGIGGIDHSTTTDGLSLTMQINYFGPFLLTILLLGLMRNSAPSRIVHISSDAARLARLNVNDLNECPRGFSPKTIEYSNTKLCNILFSNELAKRLRGTGIDTNALHPGAVRTDLVRNLKGFVKVVLAGASKLFYKTSEEGAQTAIYVACSKEIEGVSGEYFADCKKKYMPKKWRDEELLKTVWLKSEEYVKLTPEEKLII